MTNSQSKLSLQNVLIKEIHIKVNLYCLSKVIQDRLWFLFLSDILGKSPSLCLKFPNKIFYRWIRFWDP